MAETGPVFVVGMARSGTTLTRALIDAHPRLAVMEETHFLTQWMWHFSDADIATPSGFARFWSAFTASRHFERLALDPDEVEARIRETDPPTFRSMFTTLLTMYAEANGKVRFGEKTPGHIHRLGLIFDWFPDAKVVVMRRDPRAVVASYKATDRAWTELPFDRVARRWARTYDAARAWAADARVREVPYERLVQSPDEEIRAVFEWLGEAHAPEVLEHEATPDRPERQGGEVRTTSIERWREVLTPEQTAMVEYVCRAGMAHWGYEPTGAQLPLLRRAALDAVAAGSQLRRVTRRTVQRVRS